MSTPRPRTPKLSSRGKRLQQSLQAYLTEFAINIGIPTLPNGKCDKQRYNQAWLKLWQKIHRLNLLPKGSGA